MTLQPFPFRTIIAELGEWRLWVVLALAFLFGLLGSFSYEMVEKRGFSPSSGPAGVDVLPTPGVDVPPTPSRPDGGLWFRVLLGGFAAVAVLYPLSPDGLVRLIALSLIAGSMGIALFKALRSRVEAMVQMAQLRVAVASSQAFLQGNQRPPAEPVV